MCSYFKCSWDKRKKNSENFSYYFNVFEELLCLYDLGAAGGTPPPFLFLEDNLRLVNFEPDSRSTVEGTFRNIAAAVGPKDKSEIYLNQRPTTSSLLPPNKSVTDRYDGEYLFGSSEDIFETVAVESVETSQLDEAVTSFELPQPDFLKIDVQGLSLEVLQGASETMDKSVLGIEVEVEFLESYLGQKTMGYIHEQLFENGYEIFRLKNLNKWYYKTKLPLVKRTGQDTFCDLIYFKSIDSIERQPEFWNSGRAIKMIQLLLLYDLTDSAAAFYETFDANDYFEQSQLSVLSKLISNWEGSLDFFYLPVEL